MKKIILYAFSFVILTFILSCGEDSEDIRPDEIEYKSSLDSMFESYLGENYKTEFELYSYMIFQDDYIDDVTKLAMLGIKNKHLWLGIWNKENKNKIFEWTETNSFEYHRTVDKGFGVYKDVDISSMQIYRIIQTSKGYLLDINYNVGTESYFNESYSLYNSKLEKLNYNIQKRWFEDYILCMKGDKIIVSPDGEILTDITSSAIAMLSDAELFSYNEGIKFSDLTFSRIKYDNDVWKTKYKPSFNVESDTKIESEIIEKKEDTWEYKLVFTYYSGEKKTVNLILNINEGSISVKN